MNTEGPEPRLCLATEPSRRAWNSRELCNAGWSGATEVRDYVPGSLTEARASHVIASVTSRSPRESSAGASDTRPIPLGAKTDDSLRHLSDACVGQDMAYLK